MERQLLEYLFPKEMLEKRFGKMSDEVWLKTALTLAFNLAVNLDREHFNDSYDDMMFELDADFGFKQSDSKV